MARAREPSPGPVPISHHYAPGTRQNLRAATAFTWTARAAGSSGSASSPRTRYYWDTTALRDGPYRLTVTAWDIVGNRARESIDVVIANNV